VRARTPADEPHDLSVEVAGDRVSAYLDGPPLSEERGVWDTAGGVGLWARVTTTACFTAADIAPLSVGSPPPAA
jgi:hypothetical protein